MKEQTKNKLDSIFYPENVALVGSMKEGKIGYEVLQNILDHGFQKRGNIYPINPDGGEVLGLKVYESIDEVPELDLSVIASPAKYVPSLVEESADKGANGSVIISSGFGEVGNTELKEELDQVRRENDIRVIGPNCAGIFSTHHDLYASFELPVEKGDLAFITQSGAFGGAALGFAKERGIGFSSFVSYGNALDLNEIDFIEYFADDDNTGIIGVYLEGTKDGKELMSVIEDTDKPVIIIKSGKSSRGSEAVSSHTGSLAGSYKVYNTALRQAGAVEVEGMEEFFDAVKTSKVGIKSSDSNVAVVTNSGGPGIMCTDKLESLGLNVVELSEEIKEELREFLPDQCSVKNPIDIIADADYERYKRTIEIVDKDDKVDSIVNICVPPVFISSKDIANAVIDADYNKPLVANFMSGELVDDGVEMLEEENIPNFLTPERAAKAAHWISKED